MTFAFKEFINTTALAGGVYLIALGTHLESIVMVFIGAVIIGFWNGHRRDNEN